MHFYTTIAVISEKYLTCILDLYNTSDYVFAFAKMVSTPVAISYTCEPKCLCRNASPVHGHGFITGTKWRQHDTESTASKHRAFASSVGHDGGTEAPVKRDHHHPRNILKRIFDAFWRSKQAFKLTLSQTKVFCSLFYVCC